LISLLTAELALSAWGPLAGTLGFVCRACSTARGWKSLWQPDGGEVI